MTKGECNSLREMASDNLVDAAVERNMKHFSFSCVLKAFCIIHEKLMANENLKNEFENNSYDALLKIFKNEKTANFYNKHVSPKGKNWLANDLTLKQCDVSFYKVFC